MKEYLIEIVAKFLLFLVKQETLPELQPDEARGLMSQMYENPTVRKYLIARENYLIQQCAESILQGKPPHTEEFGGRLSELRELHLRLKANYLAQHPIDKNKKAVVKQ